MEEKPAESWYGWASMDGNGYHFSAWWFSASSIFLISRPSVYMKKSLARVNYSLRVIFSLYQEVLTKKSGRRRQKDEQ
jgi:hypothetical protein